MNETIKHLPNGDFEVLMGDEARRHEEQLRQEFQRRVAETKKNPGADVARGR